jgi:cell division protein FtsZ
MMGSGQARGEQRAREAAELAIRSPLLEDVDLQGARGILVNITAGTDLTLGEFAEVGDTVEEFASDNATVVVGTVIDPSMNDEIKVTVVATGIGREASADRPVKVVDNTAKDVPTGPVDYSRLDHPTIMRNSNRTSDRAAARANASAAVATAPKQNADSDMDYLDIPAFLRRQAD